MQHRNKFTFCLFVGIFLILFSGVGFSQTNLNNYQYLKLHIENDIGFSINSQSLPYINYVNLTSYFFPQTIINSQYLNSFNSTQNYQLVNDSGSSYLKFSLPSYNLRTQNLIKNSFVIQSVVTRPKITKTMPYPVENISPINQKYLQFSGLIDTNSLIKKQASELAQGENDEFVVASKIAKWVEKDVHYNLSSITQLPNQTSTQVFATKKGVCKEITDLYISMLRSVGIPARVVSGYAWTNDQSIINLVGSNWGGHAWAEVLIGNQWVPFDLTYNQFGYVDASHIVLDKSTHIRSEALKALTISKRTNNGVSPNIENLNVKNSFSVLDKKQEFYNPGFNLKASGPTNLGFGSYGYIKVNITNQDNYYKVLFLKLSNIKQVTMLNGTNSQMVIFRPDESKIVYFKYQITPNLSPNYIYTFPFEIYSQNLQLNYSVKVQNGFLKLSLNDLPKDNNFSSISFTNKPLQIACSLTYAVPENIIECSIKNENNFILKNLSVCSLENNCANLNLSINEQKTITLKTKRLNDTLTFNYKNSSSKIFVAFKKPKITYEKKLENNVLSVNTLVTNFTKNMSLNIFVNGVRQEIISSKEGNFNIVLDKETNLIKLELNYMNKTFDSVEFNQSVDQKYLSSQINATTQNSNNTSPSIIDMIINFFKKLFGF